MKQKFISCCVLLLYVQLVSFAQQAFFWAGSDKINLTVDSTQILFKVKDQNTVNQIIADFQKSDNKPGILELGGFPFILVKSDRANNLMINNSAIEFKQYVYYQGEVPYYFNGRILLRPKNDVAISNIIEQFNKEITLTSKLSSGTYFFQAKHGEKVLDISNLISKSGLVEWCQPDFRAEIVKHIFPNDPMFNDQYYLHNTGQFGGAAGVDINAPEAWDVTLGCNTLRVAVIDDGVENHDDLQGRVLQGFTALDANGFGRPSGVCTGNFPNQNRVGHGMAVTGIIAASHNNIGVAGVAPNSLIYPINIFFGGEMIGDVVTSMNRAWDPNFGNADVINNSWGYRNTTGPPGAVALTNEITAARTSGRVRNGVTLGCVVVFASGNDNIRPGCGICYNGVSYPANVEGVVTVGAVDNSGNIHDYSSRGPGMDLVAPSGGVDGNPQIDGCAIPSGNVRTIDRPGGNGYDAGDFFTGFNGTSAAAPQVTGVVALMLSANPSLTESQVLTFLQQTATDMGAGGYDDTFGFGRTNAETAVKRVLGGAINGPNLLCTSGSFSLAQTIPGIVNWSTSNSNGLTINSSGVATRVGSFSGFVNIIVSIANGCGSITKTVWVGTPYSPTSTVVMMGPSSNQLCRNQTMGIAVGNTNNTAAQGVTQYNWDFGSWASDFDSYDNIPLSQARAYLRLSSGSASSQLISVYAQNSCGNSSPYSSTFYAINCGSFLMSYPNPAKDDLTLSFDQSKPVKLPDQIDLINEDSQKSVYRLASLQISETLSKEKNITIPVKNFARGIYYLHLTRNDDKNVERIRIILE